MHPLPQSFDVQLADIVQIEGGQFARAFVQLDRVVREIDDEIHLLAEFRRQKRRRYVR